MNKDILICGVGGQGTVLASRIIAAAAMDEGSPVHSAETIGMAQRGGSVTSHVRIGGEAYSPMIPFGAADMILAFEPGEAVRNLRYLRRGGTAVVNTVAVKPVTESLKDTGYDGSEMMVYLEKKCDCIFVNAEEVCAPFGSSNLGLRRETLLKQIEKYVPAKYLDVNIRAFNAGIEIAGQANLKGEK